MERRYRILALWACTALLLAFSAPPLAAEGLKVGGALDAAFGLLKSDDGTASTSTPTSFGAAAINFSAVLGAFSAEAEIGVTQDAAFDYGEHRITWQAADRLSLSMSGAAPGLPGVDGFLGVLAGEGTGAPGDPDVFFDYSDAGLFNLDYGGESLTVGFAVSNTCVPECGQFTVVPVDNPDGVADQERTTYVLTARGKAGALDWQAYAASSKGTNVADDVSGKGSGTGLSVQFASETLRVAMDAAGGQTDCVTGCVDPIKLSNAGVAVEVGGFGLQYAQLSRDAGAGGQTDTTAIDVRYHFAADPGIVYGPQYSSASVDDGATKTTESYLFFVIAAAF